MTEVFEGLNLGKGKTFGIVVSRFNEYITKALLEGALNELRRVEVLDTDIFVTWVPGAHEIPIACQMLIEDRNPDAVITLGCIIRGETTHYEHLAQSVCDSIQNTALKFNTPISFGVITVENVQQAIDRSGGKVGNKGRDAAKSAIEMAQLAEKLRKKSGKEEELRK